MMIGSIRRRIKDLLSKRHIVNSKGENGELVDGSDKDIGPDIDHDNLSAELELNHQRKKSFFEIFAKGKSDSAVVSIKSRNWIERLAYRILASHLPKSADYKRQYEQSGIPIMFESYLSTSIITSFVLTAPAFIISFLLEYKFLSKVPIDLLLVGSGILAAIVLGISLFSFICYPMFRARSSKSKLEEQLAHTFGILGVLSASGISLERLFEGLASSESNPVVADLAKRFLRNIRIFGLDSESALKEVADHSPSQLFAKMLQSISVAHRTTGTIRDLIVFESSRLLQEKRDQLKKTVSNLSVLAELYITLVVIGPIIFVVMMSIFALLPEGGLPNPVSIINLIVLLVIPLFSTMFLLLLDSVIGKS